MTMTASVTTRAPIVVQKTLQRLHVKRPEWEAWRASVRYGARSDVPSIAHANYRLARECEYLNIGKDYDTKYVAPFNTMNIVATRWSTVHVAISGGSWRIDAHTSVACPGQVRLLPTNNTLQPYVEDGTAMINAHDGVVIVLLDSSTEIDIVPNSIEWAADFVLVQHFHISSPYDMMTDLQTLGIVDMHGSIMTDLLLVRCVCVCENAYM